MLERAQGDAVLTKDPHDLVELPAVVEGDLYRSRSAFSLNFSRRKMVIEALCGPFWERTFRPEAVRLRRKEGEEPFDPLLRDDPPVLDDGDPLADRFDQVQLVAADDDRPALVAG